MEVAAASAIQDQRQISRVKLCLPMAIGCQLLETATSAGRRFWGSYQASEAPDYITLSAFGPRAQSA
jgi:hypothetical protein